MPYDGALALLMAAPSSWSGDMRTNFPSEGNLVILPVGTPANLTSEPKQFKYVASVARAGHETKEVTSTGWRFRLRGALPQRLVTLLLPFKDADLPGAITAEPVGTDAIRVQIGKRTDRIAWGSASTAPGGTAVQRGDGL